MATGSISINAEFELIFALARYHPNGVLDNSFGTSGVVITQFGWNHAMGSAVVMRPGGKIMAAGSVRIDPLVDSDFALARFNPDGLLDSTFGSGGLVTIDFGGSDYASDLTLHYDGKIVIGGTTRDSTGVNNFALARYMPPLLDEPEGGAGMRSFDVGASGGTFTFGPVKIVIPAGLLNDGSRLVVEELDPSDEGNFQLGNRIFDITIYGPDGILITSFNPPLKICIKPTNAELQRTDWNIANLQMFHRHDGGSWTILVYTYAENGSICAAISELSYFAIGIAPLPNTGFAPNLEFDLPEKPAGQAYSSMDSYQLIIPALEVELPIVGVPLTAQGWDVSWLGEQAGYLEGTAFPTWAGNTAITAHVWDASNNPGPFVDLHTLKHGDRIEIHAFGIRHIYEVLDTELVPADDSSVLSHAEYDVLTLISCKDFNVSTGEYDSRLVVRAVLIYKE